MLVLQFNYFIQKSFKKMLIKKINLVSLKKILSSPFNSFLYKYLINKKQNVLQTSVDLGVSNKITMFSNNKYFMAVGKNPTNNQNKLSFDLQKASTLNQLKIIFRSNIQNLNFIHRVIILQKVTSRPFDADQQFTEQVINHIKSSWKKDFPLPNEQNSRAIANIIGYMGRRPKIDLLDQLISVVDYNQLVSHLNPKQFAMTINGLLKLNLIDKITNDNPQFNLYEILTLSINEQFIPPLIVSIWFNLLKFKKSSREINNFFGNRLKAKHFKNNLIDYMQILYCYVNSQGQRNVNLEYPIMSFPTQFKQGYSIKAYQLSVLYDQLVKIKKINPDIYFSDQFNQLLQSSYLKIINQRDIPLRNIANVFNYLVLYQSPTAKILQTTYHKYFAILKNEIGLLQHSQNKKFRSNVDPLSFVSLFAQLAQFYHQQNTYLLEMYKISINYLEKIINQQNFIKECQERTFVRLLSSLDIVRKGIEQKFQQKVSLSQQLKFSFEKQILKRNIKQNVHLGKLIIFASNFDIRSRQVCRKFQKIIKVLPKEVSGSQNPFTDRLKQPCILRLNCPNCASCFK